MTFRQVTVLKPKRDVSSCNESYFEINVTIDKEIRKFIVWKKTHHDIFHQIEYATHDLLPEDYPIDINVRIDGIVHSIEAPKYDYISGKGLNTQPHKTY